MIPRTSQMTTSLFDVTLPVEAPMASADRHGSSFGHDIDHGVRSAAKGVTGTQTRRRPMLASAVLLAVIGLLLCGSANALADVTWRIVSVSDTTVAPGGQLTYHIEMANIRNDNTDFVTPTKVTIRLPAGMRGVSADTTPFTDNGQTFDCPGVAGATTIICTGTPFFSGQNKNTFTLTAAVDPSTPESSVLTTAFDLDGGGAPDVAHTVDPVTVSSAPPGFGVDAFDASATKGGVPLTQAGGHPDELTTSIDFNTFTDPSPVVGDVRPVEDTKDLSVELPPGLVGNPTGLDQCTQSEIANGEAAPKPLCPATSQIGIALVRHSLGTLGPLPVYNMVPPPGVPARFAFNVAGSIIVLDAHVRSGGDYGLGVTASNTPQGLAIVGSTVTLWGVPADPSHDADRACPGLSSLNTGGSICPSGARRTAFFRNPTSCTAPGVGLTTTATIDSWQDPGVFRSATFTSHQPPGYPFAQPDWGPLLGIDGCDAVPFTPSFAAQPSAGAKAGAPTGLAVDLAIPQDDSADAPTSQSDLRRVTVTLPQGVRVSPSSADGLGACNSDQIALTSTAEPTCPDSSKIGTVTIDTPLLDVPVTGSIFLAKPYDNPFSSLIAVYIVASAKGVVLKLPGHVVADPVTGQLTATFDDNPQLPFSALHAEFKGGARAPLVLARECGSYSTHAELTGWSAKTVAIDSPFVVDQGCSPESAFAPALEAGVVNPVAGTSSSFSLRVTREDADQEIRSVTTRVPEGLLARIGDVAQCTSVPECPAASQIGRVTVGAGAGPSPFFIDSGRVYLTGPYQGAPFGLLIRVPAVAGPFDLGTVDVRAALSIDPVTAAATVVADPLPQYLQGIPVLAKDIRVSIDRPGFMVNPTDCTPTAIGATIGSFDNTNVDLSNRFQVGDCAALVLKPKLSIALSGKGQTTDGKHPAVTAKLTQAPGQANLKKVRVELPLSLALDSTWEERNQLCEFVDGSKPIPTCKANSIVGTAKATTPLLSTPLSGPVYFVKNVRKDPKSGREIRTLPKLVVALTGENGLKLTLTGSSEVVDNRLVTTFDQIPDAPVTAFELDIQGGAKRGVLVVSGTDVCKVTQNASQQIDGQNGKAGDASITLATPACGLKILSKTVGKASVTLKIGGLGAGKVTITGKGIKKTTKTITTATVATIAAQRTKGRPGKVTVAFDPAGPAKARKTSK
jgi:hypothetical protein